MHPEIECEIPIVNPVLNVGEKLIVEAVCVTALQMTITMLNFYKRTITSAYSAEILTIFVDVCLLQGREQGPRTLRIRYNNLAWLIFRMSARGDTSGQSQWLPYSS